MLHIARLTSKDRAIVPAAIREALELKAGDLVGFELEGGEVRLRRVAPLDVAFDKSLEKTLGKWSSETDDQAFASL